MFKKLLRRLCSACHVHQWMTTHVNRWQIPTVQRCECGLTRKVEQSYFKGRSGLNLLGLVYRWSYSDGSKGEWRPIINNPVEGLYSRKRKFKGDRVKRVEHGCCPHCKMAVLFDEFVFRDVDNTDYLRCHNCHELLYTEGEIECLN